MKKLLCDDLILSTKFQREKSNTLDDKPTVIMKVNKVVDTKLSSFTKK